MADVVKIGLLGYGTVGQAFAHLMQDQHATLTRILGASPLLVGALVHSTDKPRPGALPISLLADPDALLAEHPDIVVDAMGGTDPALGIYRQALSHGCHVVSANKELLAFHGPELAALANASGRVLLYEAAVAAGTPLIAPLAEHVGLLPVQHVSAVVNGTTNFILHALEQGQAFDEALLSAQRAGFAEADPSNDLSGRDAARKLVLLSRLLWQVHLTPDDVPTFGIADLDTGGVQRLSDLGFRVRMVAEAGTVADDRVAVSVAPRALALHHPFARLEGPDNSVLVHGPSGRFQFGGPGAGGLATAHALITDVLRARRGVSYPAPAPRRLLVLPRDAFRPRWLLVWNRDQEIPAALPNTWETWAPGVVATPPLSPDDVRSWVGERKATALIYEGAETFRA